MLDMPLFGKTLPAKMQLAFVSSFAAIMPKQIAYKNGALGHQWKDSETHKQTFTVSERNIRQMYVYCEIFAHHTP